MKNNYIFALLFGTFIQGAYLEEMYSESSSGGSLLGGIQYLFNWIFLIIMVLFSLGATYVWISDKFKK